VGQKKVERVEKVQEATFGRRAATENDDPTDLASVVSMIVHYRQAGARRALVRPEAGGAST